MAGRHEYQRLTYDFAAASQNLLAPGLVVWLEYGAESVLCGMVDSASAVVMPTILGSQRGCHADGSGGAELLRGEEHLRLWK